MSTTQLYSKQTQELITELLENSHVMDDIKYFIETYGEKNFRKYYEEYVTLGENYDYNAVDAFIKIFGVDQISNFDDAYRGHYPNFRDFAQEIFDEVWAPQIPVEIECYFDMDSYERDLRFEFYHTNEYVFQDY